MLPRVDDLRFRGFVSDERDIMGKMKGHAGQGEEVRRTAYIFMIFFCVPRFKSGKKVFVTRCGPVTFVARRERSSLDALYPSTFHQPISFLSLPP